MRELMNNELERMRKEAVAI